MLVAECQHETSIKTHSVLLLKLTQTASGNPKSVPKMLSEQTQRIPVPGHRLGLRQSKKSRLKLGKRKANSSCICIPVVEIPSLERSGKFPMGHRREEPRNHRIATNYPTICCDWEFLGYLRKGKSRNQTDPDPAQL